MKTDRLQRTLDCYYTKKKKKKEVNKHGSGQNVGKRGVCNEVFTRAACLGVSKLGSKRVNH